VLACSYSGFRWAVNHNAPSPRNYPASHLLATRLLVGAAVRWPIPVGDRNPNASAPAFRSVWRPRLIAARTLTPHALPTITKPTPLPSGSPPMKRFFQSDPLHCNRAGPAGGRADLRHARLAGQPSAGSVRPCLQSAQGHSELRRRPSLKRDHAAGSPAHLRPRHPRHAPPRAVAAVVASRSTPTISLSDARRIPDIPL